MRGQVWITVIASVIITLLAAALGGVFWTANTALMKASTLEGRMGVLERLLVQRLTEPSQR